MDHESDAWGYTIKNKLCQIIRQDHIITFMQYYVINDYILAKLYICYILEIVE